MDRQIGIYPYNNKYWTDSQNDMNKSQKDFKKKQPDSKDNIAYDCINMKFQKRQN